jgi:hypothetical protein
VEWVEITGVRRWDGRYRFDIAENPPTTREWGWIKRMSGYLPMTLEDGFRGGDPELVCAFAVIALRRAGRIENDDAQRVFDELQDASFGSKIRIDSDTEPVEGEETVPDPTGSSNGNTSSSGTDSTTSSETSPATPASSGTPAPATSASPSKRWGT